MPPALTLRAETGSLAGADIPWPDGGTIGRDAANALLLKDNGISRKHAAIAYEDGDWWVTDLDSRNGTFVDGQKVRRHVLRQGTLLQIGATVLRCDLGGAVPPAPAEPAVTEAIHRQSLDFLKAAPDAPEQVARSGERLVGLFEFAAAAAEAPTLEALWEKAGAALASALPADRAFVLRPRGRAGAWEPHRPQTGLEAALTRVPVSSSVAGYVRERGDSVLFRSPGADKRFAGSGSLSASSVASVICVPVRHGEETLGALYADRLGDAAPFGHADLELAIAFAIALAAPWARIAREAQLLAGQAALERELESRHDLVGRSPLLGQVLSVIDRAAPTDAAVLITGESGVGKELVARAIHRQGPRAKGPFEVVNCAVLTEALFESELFGHLKGAFTGAQDDRPGRFELADRGTLFLDEVGDLPESCQTKLLRVLEDGRIRRLGDTRDRTVDVRVVAATNRRLEGEGSRFRQDLYYRLNVLRIEVPPLRARKEDIPLLAAHYARRFSAACQKPPKTLSPAAVSVLAAHPWPGNVRELRNCVERMVVLSDRAILDVADIPSDIRASGGRAAASAGAAAAPLVSLEEVEKAHVARVLEALGGNKKRAAEVLGIDRGTLYAKLERYGIGGP